MFTESSIQALKDKLICVDVVKDYVTLKKRGVNYEGLCPFHAENTPSFLVSPKKNICKCFGCGKGGNAVEFIMKHLNKTYPEALKILAIKYKVDLESDKDAPTYTKPVWRNQTELSDKVVKWFEESRKISQKTLKRARVTEGIEWMPMSEKNELTIQYNYFVNEVLTNTKYRGKSIKTESGKLKKNLKFFSGGKLVFYNLDSIKGKSEAFITEGENDTLALIESGYWNDESGVVSIPNGASKFTNNLSYVDNCIDAFNEKDEKGEYILKKIHLALDNDPNGRKLREELAERFGKERCDYIEWKDKKDSNEVLITYGINGVIECCSNPIEFPIKGVFTISDYENEIDDMYVNGLDKGIDLEIPNFDLNIVKGYITIITGVPSHGKSSFLDFIVIRLIIMGFKGAFYSPENKPTQLHFSKLCRKLIGKHWDKINKYGRPVLNYISDEEKNQAKKFLNKKVWFIEPEQDFTMTSILQQIREVQVKYGLDFFVIDAWNKLEHKGKGDTDYISTALDELANFCSSRKLHCFLVAHPTKMLKDKSTGLYEVATMYNISGSSAFYNKADNGISVYRNYATKTTQVYRQKIKFDHWGEEGVSEYHYDLASTRYYVDGCMDNSNWITKQANPVIKEENTEEGVFQYSGEIDDLF